MNLPPLKPIREVLLRRDIELRKLLSSPLLKVRKKKVSLKVALEKALDDKEFLSLLKEGGFLCETGGPFTMEDAI